MFINTESVGVRGSGFFPMVNSDRTRGKENKLGHRKFPLNMWRNFLALRVVEHWNRRIREVVKFPSLESVRTHPEVTSNPCHSVIL